MKVTSQNPYSAIYANEAKNAVNKVQADREGEAGSNKPSVRKTMHAETTELYNADGKVTQKPDAELQKEAKETVNKESVMKEIWEQTYSLLQEYTAQMGTSDEFEEGIKQAALNANDETDPLGLGAFFAENPEALEQVENGEVPDYFNVENTGDRILDIWTSEFDGKTDTKEFIELVKNYINKAYSEVSEMFNGLPQIVQDTQDYVMQQLNNFAQDQSLVM